MHIVNILDGDHSPTEFTLAPRGGFATVISSWVAWLMHPHIPRHALRGTATALGLRRSRWLTLTGHHKPTSSLRAKPPTLLVENPAYWCLSNGCCPTDLQQIRDLMSTDFSRYKGPGVVVFSAKGLTAQVEAVRTNPGTRDA